MPWHITLLAGDEDDKTVVRTNEVADHSVRYMVAVALLDDQVISGNMNLDKSFTVT